jgi:hypothetical protein
MVRHEDGIAYYSTWDLIKRFFTKNKKYKEKLSVNEEIDKMPSVTVEMNHLAIVLDGEVQEIMRAQNRLAALLLSEPKFVEYDPSEFQIEIGWLYDGKEFTPGE